MKETPTRPRWLKVTIGVLSAWASFILTLAILMVLIFIIQSIIDIEIEGTPALLLLILALFICGYTSYIATKWQNLYFSKKSRRINYIYLVFLILLVFLTLPVSLSYVTVN